MFFSYKRQARMLNHIKYGNAVQTNIKFYVGFVGGTEVNLWFTTTRLHFNYIN